MSRGFVKEDDQEEAPFIPPRAALPDDVPNHVTPRGLRMLLEERSAMEADRAALSGNEQEVRRALAELDGRLVLLNERIATARVVEPAAEVPKDIRFGTTVTFLHLLGRMKDMQMTFTIVGVDEANVREGRIAFTAPIARALLGKRKGGVAELRLGHELQRMRVLDLKLPEA